MNRAIPERWQESVPFDWTPEEQAWIREHAGIYIWDKQPEAPGEPRYGLSDFIGPAKELGFRAIRPFLGGYGSTVPDCSPEWDYVETLQSPAHQEAIRTFDTIMYTVSTPSPQIWQPDWTAPRYQEITEYLLRTTANKTFVLGNWEGDHWIPGKDHTWEEAIALFRARHDGIVAGRAAVPGATSKVYEMIEMVTLDYTGEDRMINRLAPLMQADLYSLSAWGYTDELTKAITYMKSKCPPSPDFGNDNVMLGEFGFGRSMYNTPEERVHFFQPRVRELMALNVPYFIYWMLGDKDDGLIDDKHHESRKLLLYYLFSRTLHAADPVLTIDDFEIGAPGPPGGDQDEDGYSVNTVGGRRGPVGEAVTALAWAPDGGSRALQMTLPEGCSAGSGWQEQLLGGLDASRYGMLALRAQGDLTDMRLRLTDAAGGVATAALSGSGKEWREVLVSRGALTGVDWSRLSTISLVTDAPGDGRVIRVDDVEFAPADASGSPRREPGLSAPRVSHLALTTTDQPIALDEPSLPLRQIRLTTPVSGDVLTAPELRDGERTLRLAQRLPGLHTLTLNADGPGGLALGPLDFHIGSAYHSALGLTAHDLVWSERHRVLQPARPGQQCFLEWLADLSVPITGYRLVFYTKCHPERQAKFGIAVSSDGASWRECELTPGLCHWREDCHFATTAADDVVANKLYVRFWVSADAGEDNWQSSANITDLKIRLTLDTGAVAFPRLRELRYRDASPGDGLRGLLDLDW